MGCLQLFNKITNVLTWNKFDVFVETGLGAGSSLDFARQFQFKKLYSVEIVEKLAKTGQRKFSIDNRVEVFCDESVAFLERLLPTIGEQSVFFFLDAHWPGLDFKIQHEMSRDRDIALPVQKELNTISRLRNGRDVVVVDDLRIYMDGMFQSGNLDRRDVPVFHDSRLLDLEQFKKTHHGFVFFEDDGYLLLVPRGEK